ncbi:hypothetical protein T439DRAFT_356045 [Meredithblackwellia eburnea MCA 4105]
MSGRRALPDTHPDGDPFAAQDAQKFANSALGRLEARARLEEQQLQQSPGARAQQQPGLRTSSRSTSSAYSSNSRNNNNNNLQSSKPTPPPPTSISTSAATQVPSSPAPAHQPTKQSEVVVIDSSDEDENESTSVQGQLTGNGNGNTSQVPVVKKEEPIEMDSDSGGEQEAEGDGEGDVEGSGEDDSEEGEEEDDDDDDSDDDDDDDDDDDGSSDSEEGEGDSMAVDDERERDRRARESSGLSSVPTSPHLPRAPTPPGMPSPSKNLLNLPPALSGNLEGGTGGESADGVPPAPVPANEEKPKKKLKKKQQQKKRSLSPVATEKVRVQVGTVRLSIQLPPPQAPGADLWVPEYSIADLAREGGFYKESDVVPGEDEGAESGGSGGSGDESGDSDDEGAGKRKKLDGVEGETPAGSGTETPSAFPSVLAKPFEAGMEGVESTDTGTPLEGGGAGTEGENGAIPPAPAPGSGLPPPRKRRRKNKVLGRLGGYDVDDPFVDDSDIALYEPQWYHRPKREGYFVCTGQLELVSDSLGPGRGRRKGSKNKPKFDKDGNLIPATRKPKGSSAAATPTPSISGAPGARPGAPSGGVPSVLQPVDGTVPAFGSGAAVPQEVIKPKKKEPGVFAPELMEKFAMLRAEVAQADFSVKSKFPPHLRPILVEIGLFALSINEFDDDFLAQLPKIFPYNHFTMKKLIKREMYPARIELLENEQLKAMEDLERGIAEELPRQQEEFLRSHQEWKVAQLEKEANGGAGSGAGSMGGGVLGGAGLQEAAVKAPASDAPSIAGEDATMGSPGPEPESKDDGEAREPKWKFRFTEAMRLALFQLYTLEDSKTELTVEKQGLEKATEREGPTREKAYTALAARKTLYAKVNALWPEGLMTTNQLSREVSITKKKLEKLESA